MILPEPPAPALPADAKRYKNITSQARSYGMTSPEFLKVLDNLGIRSRKGGIPADEAVRDGVAHLFPLSEDAEGSYPSSKPRPTTYWKWHDDKLCDLLAKHGVNFVPPDERRAVINGKRFKAAAIYLAAHKELDLLLASAKTEDPINKETRDLLKYFSLEAAELLKRVRRKDDSDRDFGAQETLIDMDIDYCTLRDVLNDWIDDSDARKLLRHIRAIAKGAVLFSKVIGMSGDWCMQQ